MLAVLSVQFPDSLPCAAVCRLLLIGALSVFSAGHSTLHLMNIPFGRSFSFLGNEKAVAHIPNETGNISRFDM